MLVHLLLLLPRLSTVVIGAVHDLICGGNVRCGHQLPTGTEAQVHENHGGCALAHDRGWAPGATFRSLAVLPAAAAANCVLCAPQLDVAPDEGSTSSSVGASSVQEVVFVVTT